MWYGRTASLVMVCMWGLWPAGAAAQALTLGVKGGLNIATLSVDDPADPELGFDSRIGLHTGAFAQLGLGRLIAVQPEVLYSPRGGKSREGDRATELRLSYVEIPLLLMARLSSRESLLYPVLYAGPWVAFQTGCRLSEEGGGESTDFDCEDPELAGALEPTKTDLGLVFGGGFEILFSRLTVQLEARYNLGLTDLNDEDAAAAVSVETRAWSFLVGLGVPVG